MISRRTIRRRTTYLARAARKPKANGDRNADAMKPIVQILSFQDLLAKFAQRQETTNLACLQMKRVHVRNDVETL